MIASENRTYGIGALSVRLIGSESVLVQGIENTPVNGFKSVPYVGECSLYDNRHRIVEHGVFHFVNELGIYNLCIIVVKQIFYLLWDQVRLIQPFCLFF